MEALTDVLKSLNLAPALYGTALVLGILLRAARASFARIGTGATYLFGVGLGMLGAVLEAASGDPWQATLRTGLALAAVVLLEQKALQMLADKFGWGMDNQWVKEKPATPTEGGTDANP